MSSENMFPPVPPTCRIECADYRDFLDDLTPGSVDLVLTDPPYAISRATGFKSLGSRSVQRFAVSMDFGEWDQAEIDLDALANRSWRVLRTGGTIIVFYDIWKIERLKESLEDAGFSMIRLIVWQKTNPVPLNSKRTYLSNSREVAVVGVKGGKPTFNAKYHNGIYSYPIPRHNGKRIHPTQKPELLLAELVKVHSHEGDLVVDPFLGGGGGQLYQSLTAAVSPVATSIETTSGLYWSVCNELGARLDSKARVDGCALLGARES